MKKRYGITWTIAIVIIGKSIELLTSLVIFLHGIIAFLFAIGGIRS